MRAAHKAAFDALMKDDVLLAKFALDAIDTDFYTEDLDGDEFSRYTQLRLALMQHIMKNDDGTEVSVRNIMKRIEEM